MGENEIPPEEYRTLNTQKHSHVAPMHHPDTQRMIQGGNFNYYPNNLARRMNMSNSIAVPDHANNETFLGQNMREPK